MWFRSAEWVNLSAIESSYRSLLGYRGYFLSKEVKDTIQTLYNEMVLFRKSLKYDSKINQNNFFFTIIKNHREKIIEFSEVQAKKIEELENQLLSKNSQKSDAISDIKNKLRFFKNSFSQVDAYGYILNDLIDNPPPNFSETLQSMGFIIPYQQGCDPLSPRKRDNKKNLIFGMGYCNGLIMSWRDKIKKHGYLTHYPMINAKVIAYQENQDTLCRDSDVQLLLSQKGKAAKSVLNHMEENKIYELSLRLEHPHGLGIRKLKDGWMEVFDPNYGVALLRQEAFPFWLIQHLHVLYDNFHRFLVLREIGTQHPNYQASGEPLSINIDQLLKQFEKYFKCNSGNSGDVICMVDHLLKSIDSVDGLEKFYNDVLEINFSCVQDLKGYFEMSEFKGKILQAILDKQHELLNNQCQRLMDDSIYSEASQPASNLRPFI